MAVNIKFLAEGVYAVGVKRGYTRAEIDEVARKLIASPLCDVRWSSDLKRVQKALADLPDRTDRVATPTGRVDLATGEIGPEPKASPRQVEFIADLLAARVRSGEGGGFFAVGAFLTGVGERTRIDMDAIRALSRSEASRLIVSLKGEY